MVLKFERAGGGKMVLSLFRTPQGSKHTREGNVMPVVGSGRSGRGSAVNKLDLLLLITQRAPPPIQKKAPHNVLSRSPPGMLT
jgi:hypothetical protein